MKKGVAILVILLLFPIISAASINMKSSYDKGETIIAKVHATFYNDLEESNVFFYRGHVKIPMDYDVGKIGDYYYIKASTLGKSTNNYSLKIKNAHYYEQGHLIGDDIVKNFSITNNVSDFAVDPGFVFALGNFSIQVRSLQDSSLTLSVSAPSGIEVSGSVALASGQVKEIIFNTEELEETITDLVSISTGNLEYTLPIYVFVQPPLPPDDPPPVPEPYCGDDFVDAGEQCDGDDWGPVIDCSDFGFNGGTLSCNDPGTSSECMFDTANCFNTTEVECVEDDCGENQICLEEFCVDVIPEPEEPYCGDGFIDAGEQCDGHNWGKIIGCSYFGFDDGTLDCIDCTLDTSLCFNNSRDFECWYNSDCDPGYKCITRECIFYEQQETCTSNDDCDLGKICKKGYCIEGNECRYNNDCRLGYECDDGICNKVDYECREDRDCDDNEICENHTCIEGERLECREDRDCKKSYNCDDGECVKAPQCNEDEDCADGYCKDEFCVECKKDNHCEDNQKCDDGKCIMKEVECVRAMDCNTSQICVKNVCVDRESSQTCDGLGGDLCTGEQKCEGEYAEVRGFICCLDADCKIPEKSSTGKIVGWGLVGIIIIALIFFFIKYKGTKRKKPDLKKIGLRR